MFEVYATTPENMPLNDIVAHAQRAESMGFDGLNVPDAVHDGLLLSTLALNATSKLKVGTGVLVVFPRSPMTVAVAAWDLQAMSNGRFELGIGTQVKGNIIHRYSTPWTKPVPRMREYIGSLRAIFNSFQTGEKLEFIGEQYQFTKLQPFFNPGPLDCGPPPIYMGAVGPLMTSLAGEISDGMITHPTNTPPRYVREVALPRIEKGAEKSGRDVSNFKLILNTLVATGSSKDAIEKEKQKQRSLLAFLFSTPAYWPSLEIFGWEAIGEQLNQLSREQNWQAMDSLITDEILEAFVPCGDYHDIADIMIERFDGLSGTINFPMPEDPTDDKLAAQAIARLKGA